MGRRQSRIACWVAIVGLVAAGCSSSSTGSAPGAAASTESSSPPVTEASVTESSDAEPSDPAPADPAELPVDPNASQWATGDAEYLFDQDTLHTFELELSTEALATLDADPAAEEYVEGSLTFDGETIEPIGIRYKGSVGGFVGCTSGANFMVPEGPKTCTKLSLKLKINWDDSQREFYGQRSVQLHAQNLDPSHLHERLGYWLFREMGVPAPRSTHARVVVNGEFVGLFGLTEVIDGRFTRANFADGTGNLYKEVWPFDGTGQPTAPEQFIAGLETNEDDGPSAELIARFAQELHDAPADQRVAVVERWADVEELLAAFVVDRAIKHDDGPLHWYCRGECGPHNFFWYETPDTGRLHYIPWDLDNAFSAWTPTTPVGGFIAVADPWGETSNDCEPFGHGLMQLTQRSAACDPLFAVLASLETEYERIRAEFVAGPFAPASTDSLLEQWTAQIEPVIAEAAAAHDDAVTVEQWQASVNELRSALDLSRAGNGR